MVHEGMVQQAGNLAVWLAAAADSSAMQHTHRRLHPAPPPLPPTPMLARMQRSIRALCASKRKLVWQGNTPVRRGAVAPACGIADGVRFGRDCRGSLAPLTLSLLLVWLGLLFAVFRAACNALPAADERVCLKPAAAVAAAPGALEAAALAVSETALW